MQPSDLREFAQILDAVSGMLSRGNYSPNELATAMFFNALKAHPMPAVRAAFEAHVADPQRGRFVPVPADLIAQIEAHDGDDGRLGAEEAWALALGAADEADAVVWTDEIAQAWGVALPVLQRGDEVGARMAFREAYGRHVAQARAARQPLRWCVALGHDSTRRADALRRAEELGRLSLGEADSLVALPAPRAPVLLLAGGTSVDSGESSPAKARALQALQALHESLAGQAEAPSIDVVERQRTEQLKARAADMVANYAGASA
jgi:hypothetical protein